MNDSEGVQRLPHLGSLHKLPAGAAGGSSAFIIELIQEYTSSLPHPETEAPLNPAPSDIHTPTPVAAIPMPTSATDLPSKLTHRLARTVLVAFLFTFIAARILVIAIMAGKLPPQLFFHVQGTHVHHLNYGIFILSFSGGFLLFYRPMGKLLSLAAFVYGIGLALTFDEFGMWLHLGGPYWQRVSYDAVITIAAVLALIAYGSTLRHWRPKHTVTIVFLLLALALFAYLLNDSIKWAGQRIGPLLQQLEEKGPS